MFVADIFYVWNGMQILADQLAQNARSRAVQDAHATQSNEDGIVDKMHHSIDGIVATHAADVQILMEILTAVFHRGTRHVRRLNGQMGVFVCGTSGFCLRLVRPF